MATKKSAKIAKKATVKATPKKAAAKATPKKAVKKTTKAKNPKVDDLFPNVKVEKHGNEYEVFRSNEAGGFKHEITSENPLPEKEN